MDLVNGTVKQYRREYTRNLKSGETRRYTTEQYTITISKQDNIFEDNQDVIILPATYKDEVLNLDNSIKTFETDNLQLKSTNKSLINNLDLQRSTIKDHETTIQGLNNENEELKNRINELEALKNDERLERFEKLQGDHDRLRNKHDHLQERLRTALEEINQQQKAITDLSNRGFTDYIFGRLPESYKQLQAPKNDK